MSNLLYISALTSECLINDIYKRTNENPGFAVQKFSRLLVKGFLMNDTECQALSVPPVTKRYTKKIWINLPNEKEDDVQYNYIPFINIPIIKHISIIVYTFFYVLFWAISNRGKKAVVCDVLCISSSIGALLASKLAGVMDVAVVTDIYDQMVGKKTTGLNAIIKELAGKLNRLYNRMFSRYVLLTEGMNEIVNLNKKPYCIVEGLVDHSSGFQSENIQKSYPRVIMYAGGLEEKYGLKMLVDSFRTLQIPDVELHLYGSGSFVNQLMLDIQEDKRIKYFGVKSNEDIVLAESQATLLVNPRFSTEEFAKYSFPSKNMEYMLSGTPLLTTKLPGMPKEYYPFVYLFEEESVYGFATIMDKIMSLPTQELYNKGLLARDFVFRYKNNRLQAKRIIEFIDS